MGGGFLSISSEILDGERIRREFSELSKRIVFFMLFLIKSIELTNSHLTPSIFFESECFLRIQNWIVRPSKKFC